jgi:hypothetical protein
MMQRWLKMSVIMNEAAFVPEAEALLYGRL